jgi:hypothetical protein
MLELMDRIELLLVAFVSKLAPWLVSALAMLLVVQTGQQFLGWPLYMAIIAGAGVECSGALALHTFMRLRDYNMTRHESDPPAPMGAAWFAAIVYFVSLFGIVATGLYDAIRQYMMMVLPLLSIADTVALSLNSSHTHRLQVAAAARAERVAQAEAERIRAARRETRRENREYKLAMAELGARQGERQALRQAGQGAVKVDAKVDTRQAVLDWYRVNPDSSVTDASQMLGISRQTVYTRLKQLESEGAISRNGHVEVLAG